MLSLVAPKFRPAVLEPENHGRGIGRDMLTGRRPDDLAVVLENLLAIEAVAGRLMVQAAFNSFVGCFLAGF